MALTITAKPDEVIVIEIDNHVVEIRAMDRHNPGRRYQGMIALNFSGTKTTKITRRKEESSVCPPLDGKDST